MEEQKPAPLLSLKEIRVINFAKRCLTNKEIANRGIHCQMSQEEYHEKIGT